MTRHPLYFAGLEIELFLSFSYLRVKGDCWGLRGHQLHKPSSFHREGKAFPGLAEFQGHWRFCWCLLLLWEWLRITYKAKSAACEQIPPPHMLCSQEQNMPSLLSTTPYFLSLPFATKPRSSTSSCHMTSTV